MSNMDPSKLAADNHTNGLCPSCGYCPSCGRRNASPYVSPYLWDVPTITTTLVPCNPPVHPTVTCGGTTGGFSSESQH